ncbi:paired amphipathic helix protein Sin3a isoform X1 [Harpegnathos saltator]|uniref:paired amphipathic helix protein Sin3a isoform X1 n=1 Tax=Harpegnathos saltator TaxID=610380 RepID=UPI00058B77F4|nr:paired amphipathic helix protein Sin3a isoform X1 [Harpegnathos saltator]XP_011143412.1 paired amphipathic helix protein Sin3a isoform X1 [Harpegnathos saltator]
MSASEEGSGVTRNDDSVNNNNDLHIEADSDHNMDCQLVSDSEIQTHMQQQSIITVKVHLTNVKAPTSLQYDPSFNSSSDFSNLLSTDKESILNYMEEVEQTFINKRQVYEDFIIILKSLYEKRLNLPSFMTQAIHMFKAYPELIVCLNIFITQCKIEVMLSDGRRITGMQPRDSIHSPVLSQDCDLKKIAEFIMIHSRVQFKEEPPVSQTMQTMQTTQTMQKSQESGATYDAKKSETYINLQSTLDYIDKVKYRFCNQPEKYECFAKILSGYAVKQKGKHGTAELKEARMKVYRDVMQLLENHKDLQDEFEKFYK